MILRTVARAIQVLHVLGDHPDGLTLAELSRAMGCNKATVHRLVATLKTFHLVTTNAADRLRLGSGILGLAERALPDTGLREISRPHLTKLRDATGETACLHLAFGYERACVEQVPSRQEIKWVAEIGKKFPITAGAPGKVLIAFLPAEDRQRVLKAVPLAALTPRSITDPKQFERELKQVRSDGYAISISESVQAAAACAAPISAPTGGVIGAVTVAGPAERLSRHTLKSYAPLVLSAAAAISKDLELAGRTSRPGHPLGRLSEVRANTK